MTAEFIETVGRRNWFISVNLLVLFGIRRICQKIGRSRSLYHFIRRAVTQLVVIIVAHYVCQQFTKFNPASCCQGLLHMQGDIGEGFDVTGQLLIIYSAFI